MANVELTKEIINQTASNIWSKCLVKVLSNKRKQSFAVFMGKVLNDEKMQNEFFLGMYQALEDYTKKSAEKKSKQNKEEKKQENNSNLPVKTSNLEESVSDYKGKEGITPAWINGYVLVQTEYNNKSTKRLRTYVGLYQTSKEARKSNAKDWKLTSEELQFLRVLTYVGARDALVDNGVPQEQAKKDAKEAVINNTVKDVILNSTGNDDNNSPEKVAVNNTFPWLYVPEQPNDVFLPWDYVDPTNVQELKDIIEKNNYYTDDDLDMRQSVVLSKQKRLGMSLSTLNDDAYLFLIVKNNNDKGAKYWNALTYGDKKQVLVVKYNFEVSLLSHVRYLLQEASKRYPKLFPMRIREKVK